MKNKTTVETLMAYEYEIVFKKKKDKFIFMIPDLFLIVSDHDIGVAYRELMAKKEAFFNQMLEEGNEGMIPSPSYCGHLKKWYLSDMKPFAIKTIVVVAIMALLGVVGLTIVKQTVTSAMSSVSDKLSPATLGKMVYLNAIRINSMTPEDREKSLKQVRTLVTAYKPFIDEVWPLLEKYPLPADSGAKSKNKTGQIAPRPAEK